MSNLYISEFSAIVPAINGVAQIALWPPIVQQKVSFTGTPGVSAAMSAATKYVGIQADGICSFAVGSNPTAAVTDARLPADQWFFFGVAPGTSLKISAITNT